MGIFPEFLEKAEDLRYVADNALSFDLTAKATTFHTTQQETSFSMTALTTSFALETTQIEFALEHVPVTLYGNNSAIQFVFTRVEIF